MMTMLSTLLSPAAWASEEPSDAPAPMAEPVPTRLDLISEMLALSSQSQQIEAAVTAGLEPEFAEPALSAIAARQAEITTALCVVAVALPPDAPTDTVPAPDFEGSMEVTFASAYAFRGYNLFQQRSQQDANGLFAPSFAVSHSESGITVGLWGAYQLNGANRVTMVESGIGAETDLYVSISRDVSDSISASAAATAFLYPFARHDVAGTTFPIYLEPSAAVAWSGAADVGLQLAYFHGVQNALATWRYLYLHPSASRSIPMSSKASVTIGGGAGYKLYVGGGSVPTDNVWDGHADLALKFTFDDGTYIEPAVHAVTTDLAGQSFAQSSFGWFGVDFGGSLAGE